MDIEENNIGKEISNKSREGKLEKMKAGNVYCLHRSWGFGVIKSYDSLSDKLIVDFPEEGKIDHRMDPVFCLDKLELLSPEHILVQNATDPKAVEEMIKKNQVGLIKAMLKNAGKSRTEAIASKELMTEEERKVAEVENCKMTSTEIELILKRLIGPTKMKKWWTETKKLLQKDPCVGVPSKKEGEFELRDEQDKVSPEREILEEYERNKNPKKKILLIEKLFQYSSVKAGDDTLPECDPSQPQPLHHYKATDPEIEKDLERIFIELTEAIQAAKKLTKAESIYGLWVRNDLCRYLKKDVDSLSPTSTDLILSCDNGDGKYEGLTKLAEEIPQSPACLKRILDLLFRVYKAGNSHLNETFSENKWKEVVLKLLENSTGKFTGECINFLVDRKEDVIVARRLKELLDSQNLKTSILTWIIKNRNSVRYKKIIAPLMNYHLLSMILYAIDKESIMATSTRRIQIVEDLYEDKGLIGDLLKDGAGNDVEEDIARDLALSLMNQGLESLTKNSLLARFIEKYPNIQKVLFDNDSFGKSSHIVSSTLHVSAKSLEIRGKELEDIIKVKLPANKEAIAIAKEHGDLKENSEYKMARQDNDMLMARKSELEADLARAQVFDFNTTPTDKVGIGSVVSLSNKGENRTYTILGAWDSDPEKNILSYQTPLARALLGRVVGDTVETEIDGNKESWTIKALSRWIDKK